MVDVAKKLEDIEKQTGVRIEKITIEGFAWKPEEYLVILRDKNHKPWDLTTEMDEPPRTDPRGKNMYHKFGIVRCPACAYQWGNDVVKSIQGLKPYEEREIECKACGSDHVYFKKPNRVDMEKVKDFLNRHMMQSKENKT